MLTGDVLRLVVAVLLIVLIGTSVCVVGISEESSELPEVDPAPLIELLGDALMMIMEGHYAGARDICSEAMAITLPSGLEYLHLRVYGKLLELVSNLERAEKVRESAEPKSPEVKVLLYELYEVKLELEDAIIRYVSELSKYFKDDATRYVMVRSVEELVASFMSRLSSDIDELVEVYLRGSRGGDVLKVTISLPKKVLGGSVLEVSAAVTSEHVTGLANLTVFVTYADTVTEVVNEVIKVGSQTSLYVRTPSAEDLTQIGVELDEELPIKVVALATASVSGEEVVGYAAVDSVLVFTRPRLTIMVPNRVYPEQPINVTILARIDGVLKAKIYLDKVDTAHLLLETDLKLGKNTFLLNLSNLSVGYHKLYVVTEPSGAYLGFTHSSAFAVVKQPLVAVAEAPEIVVIPPLSTVIHVYVDTPTPYEVTVYVENREMLRVTYLNKSRIYLTVPLPLTPLLWRYNIKVEVRSLDPLYGSVTKTLSTYVVNLPLLLAAVVALGLAMVTPASSRYMSFSLRSVLHSFSRLSRASTRRTQPPAVSKSLVRFRRPRLLKLYRKIISLLSKFSEPPKRSETLREFFRRLQSKVGSSIQQLVWRFLSMYEVDIYSQHDVSESEAREIARRLEEYGAE